MILLKAHLALELPRINTALDQATQSLPEPVRPAALHILDAGGKRLRPLLTVLTARLFGYKGDDIYDLAVTLEMLHAATLLHDDVLDNAVSRRGKPAAHIIFGIPTAVLAGDALLACANALTARFGDPRLVTCFSEAVSRTAAGEIMEIAAQGRVDLPQTYYEDVVRGKTAWLIRAACEMGALRAGAADEAVHAAAVYGENLGMAFQMVDDALDFAPESLTGKPTGGDAREGKFTPPLRLYREHLSKAGQVTFDAAFSANLLSADEAAEVAACIRALGFDTRTREEAGRYLTLACDALEGLPNATERGLMREMADYVRDRKK